MSYNDDDKEPGQLIASLDPQVRMDMVQNGYNPLLAEDVSRYKKRQKPVGTAATLAGTDKYKNLGESHYNDSQDYASLHKELQGQGIDSGFTDDLADDEANMDPRQLMTKKINQRTSDYRNTPSNLDERISSRMQLGSEEPQRRPVNIPKQTPTRNLITESTQAQKAGYVRAIKYVNSLVTLLKSPSYVNRQAFAETFNDLFESEQKIHPEVLKYYRGGIAKAEKELYSQIKTKRQQV